MGMKAKSGTSREFCEKCIKSLWLPVYNANNEIFLQKCNLILTEKMRKKEENIVTCGMLQFGDAK